nr:MAG TPA: hypothetical protein [Caudoviricetes sp.]
MFFLCCNTLSFILCSLPFYGFKYITKIYACEAYFRQKTPLLFRQNIPILTIIIHCYPLMYIV